MKIIIIGPAHPFRGGIADTNESFCQALIEEGHDASIVTFTVQYPNFLFPGKTQYTQDPKPENIPIIQSINSINPFSWFSTARKINKLNPDLVIVRYWLPFMAPSLGTITRRLNKKIVKLGMCDNILPHEKRIGDKSLTKYFLNSFDGFITLSSSTNKELDLFTTKPKKSYPHPINKNLGTRVDSIEARKHLGLSEDRKYLLFFGLIRAYKGLDLTLESIGVDKIKELDLCLLIVGEFYDSREKYDAQIEKLGLQNNVKIVNEFVPTSDIKYYFSAADLIIQTYHTASQSGITQIAYNFNSPILITNVGGLSEFVPHQKVGYVCEKDPEDIANSILDFYSNNRKSVFSDNIELEKEKYSWNTFGKRVIELHNEIKPNKTA